MINALSSARTLRVPLAHSTKLFTALPEVDCKSLGQSCQGLGGQMLEVWGAEAGDWGSDAGG